MRYWQQTATIVIALVLVWGNPAQAEEEVTAGMRADISLDMPIWPALADLNPIAPGSFDGTGFGIGASVHWPFRQFANSDLMIGLDGTIAATDSNISGFIGDVLARQLYLGGSLKWLLGDTRSVSLDVGLGYHELDMAQVDSEWWGTIEHEHFSKSTASGYVGGTWDIGAAQPDRTGGWMLGLRIHFADFGAVSDDPRFFQSVLGTDAGELDGPLYMLRVGYSSR